MNRRILAIFAVLLSGAAAAASIAPDRPVMQERRLGSIDFRNSGSAEAQAPFTEGVLLLHSFEFEDAASAFRRAQAIDREFALAYWGEAMTYNHPLWREQDRDAALAALARYAPTPEARRAKAPTEREAGYLTAIDVLYGEGTKTERDLAYMAEMERLATRYPDDLEARAFHALAILGSTDGERDFATYMRAAAAAQPVFDAQPNHPGAVHYIIHSFDDPIHAPLGLEAARAYSEIAPDAGHAQHMTSHIFVALGMWDDVVAANIRARDVQNAGRAEIGHHANACGHYTSWLHYGWLMRGDLEDAERGMSECHALVASGEASAPEVGYFVAMRARHVFDTQDWGAAQRFSADVDRPGYDFVSGLAALRRGDRETATAVLRSMRAGAGSPLEPRSRIMLLELEALLALEEGEGAQALAKAEEAADIESGLPFEFGPPASLKPPHELLGEIALELGEPEAALHAFRNALELTPERRTSLEGLLAAARAADRTAVEHDALARLARIGSGSN